jgi:hypothetical protein
MIEIVYRVPDDASDTFELYEQVSNGEKHKVPYSDFRYPNDTSYYWTVVGRNENGDNFVKLHTSGHYKRYWLYYYQKVERFADLTKYIILPDNYGIELVAPIATGELLYETEENLASQTFLNEGYGKLVSFYNKFSTFNKDSRREIKIDRGVNMGLLQFR